MQKLPYSFFILLFTSCTSYPEAIEDVFRQAGDNRKELVKTLKYYGKNPSDSLKLRAAEFLIVNMPGKYSEYFDAPWNDAATVYLRWTSSSDKQLVLDTYQLGEPVIEDDVTHITAEYLINNIELAFKVWEEMPWGKHIPFDAFCEEILPYRVSTEPLENWREKALASFFDLYKSFREDTAITTVEACSRVNDLLPRFRVDKDFPPMSYSQLMATTRGPCDVISSFTIFVMRGLGIPVTCDFTPKYVELPTGHSWNSVRDSSDVHVSFMGAESNPGQPHQGIYMLKAKAYRQMYGKQQNLMLDEADIPPLLHNINHIIDVSSEYGNCMDIRVPVLNSHLNNTGVAFLAFLQDMNWYPVAWGKVDSDSIQFQSAGINILYQSVYYHHGIQYPVSYPFIVDKNGAYRFFRPDSMQAITLVGIDYLDYNYLRRMTGGKFEVANRSDFLDAKIIHTIKTDPGPYFYTVSIKCPSSYRYIRYVSPDGGYGNVSVLEFYDKNGDKLNGTIIGTLGSWMGDITTTRDKALDDDVTTFYCSETADGAWVGLDLGEPAEIGKIRFLPRTDGNSIYEGHTYILSCWDGNQWISYEQIAVSGQLHYHVPSNALYYLKNKTLNKTSKIFTIQDRAQTWLK